MADTPYHREYFYVGGTYVPSTSDFGGCTMKDQTYVERLTPVDGPTRDAPLIFVHGAGQSGLVGISPFSQTTHREGPRSSCPQELASHSGPEERVGVLFLGPRI